MMNVGISGTNREPTIQPPTSTPNLEGQRVSKHGDVDDQSRHFDGRNFHYPVVEALRRFFILSLRKYMHEKSDIASYT